MEFVIRRWIFVSKGELGIVQFGNGIGSLAFLLVMENRHILFLSLFNCERFEVFSNILNLHSTFLSFFFFFNLSSTSFSSTSSQIMSINIGGF